MLWVTEVMPDIEPEEKAEIESGHNLLQRMGFFKTDVTYRDVRLWATKNPFTKEAVEHYYLRRKTP